MTLIDNFKQKTEQQQIQIVLPDFRQDEFSRRMLDIKKNCFLETLNLIVFFSFTVQVPGRGASLLSSTPYLYTAKIFLITHTYTHTHTHSMCVRDAPEWYTMTTNFALLCTGFGLAGTVVFVNQPN